MRVYLAGPILADGPDWREAFRLTLETVYEKTYPGGPPAEYVLTVIAPGGEKPEAALDGRDAQDALEVYGPADFLSVDLADVVVAFLGAPGTDAMGSSLGIGTAAELGYAKAKGKRILAVLADDPEAYWHWRFVVGAIVPNFSHDLARAAATVAYYAAQTGGYTRRNP